MKEMNRRKFLKGSALAATATAAGTITAPSIVRAAPVTMKMQAAWGGGIFLENAKSYVDRVNAMAGDALQIELLPVNSVVKTSQMQDAVHRGVLDAARTMYLLTGTQNHPLLHCSELAHALAGQARKYSVGSTTVVDKSCLMN